MTKRQKDYKATLDLWNWARKQNRRTMKTEWPEYRRIENLQTGCAFCHYYWHYSTDESVKNCTGCPLDNEICGDKGSWYKIWNTTIVVSQQRKAADKIYQAIKKYYDKEFKR